MVDQRSIGHRERAQGDIHEINRDKDGDVDDMGCVYTYIGHDFVNRGERSRTTSTTIVPLWRSFTPDELLLEMFFQPSDGIKKIAQNDTGKSGRELPQGHEEPEPGHEELDKLIRLVEVVLAGNIVLCSPILLPLFIFPPVVGSIILNRTMTLMRMRILLCQMQHRNKRDLAPMGRHRPDGKDLGQTDVEDLVALVEAHAGDFCRDARAHDLVPAVDAVDEVARVLRRAGAAEGVGELCVGGEVLFDCLVLE